MRLEISINGEPIIIDSNINFEPEDEILILSEHNGVEVELYRAKVEDWFLPLEETP